MDEQNGARRPQDPVSTPGGSLTERLVAEGRAQRATRTIGELPKPLRVKLVRPLSAILSDQRDDRL